MQDALEGITFSSTTSVVSTVLIMTSRLVISGGHTRDGDNASFRLTASRSERSLNTDLLTRG